MRFFRICMFLLLVLSFNVNANSTTIGNFDDCVLKFKAVPKLNYSGNFQKLCNIEYAVLFDLNKKIPVYVIEYVGKDTNIIRKNSFHVDNRVNLSNQANNKLYLKSGYDRGHLAPSNDMTTVESQYESFAYTNIAPQNPKFNETSWKNLEKLLINYNDKITGLITNNDKQMNGIVVPDYFYKIAIKDNCYVAYIGNNVTGDISKINIEDLEKMSNINFGLSKALQKCY